MGSTGFTCKEENWKKPTSQIPCKENHITRKIYNYRKKARLTHLVEMSMIRPSPGRPCITRWWPKQGAHLLAARVPAISLQHLVRDSLFFSTIFGKYLDFKNFRFENAQI
jgi:hypothetical protein